MLNPKKKEDEVTSLGSSLYVPQQLARFKREVKKRARVEERISQYSDELFFDVLDGWSTGDVLADFAVVACRGVYDETVIQRQYHHLQRLIRLNVGRYILVVQTAHALVGSDMLMLKNVHIGEVRSDEIEIDIDRTLLGLPVQPWYVVYREMLSGKEIVEKSLMIDGAHIHVGPLENKYCRISHAKREDKNVKAVPQYAVTNVYFHPWNYEDLLLDHGIDRNYLTMMTEIFIRGQKRP